MIMRFALPIAATIAMAFSTTAGAAQRHRASAPSCPGTTAFNPTLAKLTGYRVFVGPDGDSAVEPITLTARDYPLLKTGKTLHILDLPSSPTRPNQIVAGPANVDLPLHPSPYKEMFVLLGGSLTFRTAKFSAKMLPGSVLVMDDMGATHGHGGTIGPCGYVSLSIQPPKD